MGHRAGATVVPPGSPSFRLMAGGMSFFRFAPRGSGFAMFLLTSAAWTVAQEAETVDRVTDDNVIVLQNGNAYQSDDATSQTWNTGDDVLVLDDEKIVNKDQDEAVDVTPTTVSDEDDPNEDDPQ